jgi:hypothetical protein
MIFGGAMVFGSGWLAGSFLMGAYLLISLNVFGRHAEEAFSALKIQDYKSFLRLHIAEDGTLTIYPIKIERTARRFRKPGPDEEGKVTSLLTPDGGTAPELIEDPICIKCNVPK